MARTRFYPEPRDIHMGFASYLEDLIGRFLRNAGDLGSFDAAYRSVPTAGPFGAAVATARYMITTLHLQSNQITWLALYGPATPMGDFPRLPRPSKPTATRTRRMRTQFPENWILACDRSEENTSELQ